MDRSTVQTHTCLHNHLKHNNNSFYSSSTMVCIRILKSHCIYLMTNLFLFQFIMLTYIFMLAWLGVTAFTALPVFMYFNIWNICQNATMNQGVTLCLDPRQYGEEILISDLPPFLQSHRFRPQFLRSL